MEACDTCVCVCAVLHVCICACCIGDNYYVYIPLSFVSELCLPGCWVLVTLCVATQLVTLRLGLIMVELHSPHLFSTAVTVLVFPFLKIYRAVN